MGFGKPLISSTLDPFRECAGRLDRHSRAEGSILCVRRTDRGLRLNDRAPAASICLTLCEPPTALYCSSVRSSLQAATARRPCPHCRSRVEEGEGQGSQGGAHPLAVGIARAGVLRHVNRTRLAVAKVYRKRLDPQRSFATAQLSALSVALTFAKFSTFATAGVRSRPMFARPARRTLFDRRW